MKAGHYDALIATEMYIQPNNPLDVAISRGFVKLVEASNYGEGASKMWLKIYVPRDVEDIPDGWIFATEGEDVDLEELQDWAYWSPVAQDATPEERIPAAQRGDSWTLETLDAFLDTVDEVEDDISEGLESAASVGTNVAVVAGVAVVGVLALLWLVKK